MEDKDSKTTRGLVRNPSGSRGLTQTTLLKFFPEKRITGGEPTVKEEKEQVLDTTGPVKTPSQKKKGETNAGRRKRNDGERKKSNGRKNGNAGERKRNGEEGKESNGRKNGNAGERKRNDGERKRKRKQKSRADKGQDPCSSLSVVEQNEGEDTTAEHPVGSGRRENQQPEVGEEGDTQPYDEPVPVGVQEEYIAVVLGLETTDRVHRIADILQIAATPWLENGDHGAEFNVYTFPIQPINPYAAKTNGFSVDGTSLCRYGEEVVAVSLQEGLRRFLEWLRSLGAAKKLLVCNNAQRFYSPILERHVDAQGLRAEFEDVVIGFSDTLGVFRELDPERRASRDSFRRDDLIQDRLGEKSQRHDCMDSVHSLARLLSSYKAEKAIRKYSFYVGYSPLIVI